MLIHRWPLTQGPYDVVRGLTLTNNGTVTFDGRGASFDGYSQWLNGTKALPGSFTMSVWCTPVSLANFFEKRCSVMAVSDATISTASVGWIAESIVNADSMNVRCNGILYADGELTVNNYPVDKMTLSTLTYDLYSQCCSMWRDSVLLVTGTVSLTGITISSNFSLGRYGAYTGGYWGGILADARIYDHALSAAEIARLTLQGPNGIGPEMHALIATPNATILPAARGMR